MYDHRCNGLAEQCNKTVLETLRKLKLAEIIEKWWTSVDQVEWVMNGSFHKALGITPFEAYYGTMQVYKDLVTKRQQEMR